jgi:hypothetical protein
MAFQAYSIASGVVRLVTTRDCMEMLYYTYSTLYPLID